MRGSKNENGLYSIQLKVEDESSFIAFKHNSAMDWHKKLGHAGKDKMKKMLEVTEGIKLSKEEIDRLPECEVCLQSKQTRFPFKANRHKADTPLEIIHTDICGPISPTTYDNKRYILTCTDDFTNYTKIYLLTNKSKAFECLKNYIHTAERQHNLKVKTIRSDCGGEFTSKLMKDYFKQQGILLDYTTPYSPQLNGKSERFNRTIMEKVRAMLYENNVDENLWGEASKTAVYVINRIPVEGQLKTPTEKWTGRKPNLKYLQIFGCEAYSKNLGYLKKLDKRSDKYIFIGYTTTGYRLWDKNQSKVIERRDVIFVNKGSKNEKNEDNNTIKLIINNKNSNKQEEIEYTDTRDYEEIENIETDSENTVENRESTEENTENIEEEESITNDQNERISTRGRKIKQPTYLKDYDVSNKAYYCLITQSEVPETYEEAIKHEEWQHAIEKELTALEKLETWKEVKLPETKKAIDTKWIFKEKEDGTKKARLVVRGFQLKRDNKNDIMYSPVARAPTIRMLISKAVNEDLPIRQLDIPTAFLNGKIKSEVYIKPPQGYLSNNKVLKLQRALYGLDESPRCWNETIDEFAKKNGFQRSEYDYCLYYKIDCWMVVYVDDILLIGNCEDVIQKLKKEFKAKDLGQTKKFLGMEIKREKDKITLKQSNLIEKILKKFDMTNCNGIKTPMEEHFNITIKEEEIKDRYRELIGSLLHLTITSRPDLTYSVSYLSRYLDKVNTQTWKAAKRILRYLKETKNYGLVFRKSADNDLHGYSDADWAGDRSDRKSVSGSLILHGNNPVAWFSKKQTCVALSTAEAEYVAAAMTAQELLNLKGISKHLNCQGKVELLVDNQGAICMTKSYENSKRTKHIDIKYQFIKDLIIKNVIYINYVIHRII